MSDDKIVDLEARRAWANQAALHVCACGGAVFYLYTDGEVYCSACQGCIEALEIVDHGEE